MTILTNRNRVHESPVWDRVDWEKALMRQSLNEGQVREIFQLLYHPFQDTSSWPRFPQPTSNY